MVCRIVSLIGLNVTRRNLYILHRRYNRIVVAVCLIAYILLLIDAFHVRRLTERLFEVHRYLFFVQTDLGQLVKSTSEFKRILLWTPYFGLQYWGWRGGGQLPFLNNCPVWKCTVTIDKRKLARSDLVLVHLRDFDLPVIRLPGQVWVVFSLESPRNSLMSQSELEQLDGTFNWSMTYLPNSEYWAPYGTYSRRTMTDMGPVKDYHSVKEFSVVWYVSNCDAMERMIYAQELSEYISVDIFGSCGREDGCQGNRSCSQLLRQRYKFYLAFENSKCDYYVTEKFWLALRDELIPVVMGASLAQYKQLAPPGSFIHVDQFKSPKELAKYLRYLGSHPNEFNRYHEWRRHWTSRLLAIEDPCTLCALAHNSTLKNTSRTFKLSEWWSTNKCH